MQKFALVVDQTIICCLVSAPNRDKLFILFHPLGCDECSFPQCFPSLQPFFSSWDGSSTGYVHLADAGGKQGGGGEPARGHSITADAFWGKETLLGGIFFCSGGLLPGRLIEARRLLCGAELAAAAQAHWVVLTCSGIPTRCPNSHGKIQRVKQLVQEVSAAGWSERFRLCNGEVNQQRGKTVWKQKLALDKLLSLHSHDASLPAHRLGFFKIYSLFFFLDACQTRVTQGISCLGFMALACEKLVVFRTSI